MFTLATTSCVDELISETINRNLPQPPTLNTSEFDQSRIEELMFSLASPISAPFHRNRIEDLLFSPTSPVNELIPPSGRAYGFDIPQPFPRSFHQLYAQHSYLTNCLETENHKATEILRLITRLEENLIQNDESSFRRRKDKKRLGWLRRRLDETGCQESRILARLGQITFDIQTLERWTQIEFERRQCEAEQQQYFNYQQRPYLGMQQLQLDPASPEFQPQGYHWPDTPRLPASWQQWEAGDGGEGYRVNYGSQVQVPTMYPSDLATKNSPDKEISLNDATHATTGPSTNVNKLGRPRLVHRSSSLNDALEQLGVLSTNTTPASVPIVKRLSLPCLPVIIESGRPNIWALTSEEKEVVFQDGTKSRDQLAGSQVEKGQVRRASE